MTDHSREEMRKACHYLAEYILRQPCQSNRSKWLKQQAADILTNQINIDRYAERYNDEYAYADAPTEYLADVLKEFDF